MIRRIILLSILFVPVVAIAQHWESSYTSGAEIAPTLDAFKRINPEGHRILEDGTFDTFTFEERLDFVLHNLYEYDPEKGLTRTHDAFSDIGMEKYPSEGITDAMILRRLEAHNSILRRIEGGEEFYGCYEAKEFSRAHQWYEEDFKDVWPQIRDSKIKLGLLDPNCR